MKPLTILRILFLWIVICAILFSCAGHAVREKTINKPIILFWTRHVEGLTHMTHIAKGVWAGDPRKHPNGNMLNHQDTWMAKGVTPLVWAGGVCYIDESLDKFVERWRKKIRKGARALQIDEYMPQSPMVTAKMVKALEMIRREYPALYLAVWHGGVLTEPLISAYAKYVDLVILEDYFTDNPLGWLLFSVNTQRARNGHIIDKTIFGLEISAESWEAQKRYLDLQMKWIKANAPEMNGIGFFAPKADKTSVLGAEKLAVHYFTAGSPSPQ